jgi:hypothetical protein
MPRTIGVLLFDGAEEMDFVGPWEVFTAAPSGMPGDRVVTIAERSRPITCEKGMRVVERLAADASEAAWESSQWTHCWSKADSNRWSHCGVSTTAASARSRRLPASSSVRSPLAN